MTDTMLGTLLLVAGATVIVTGDFYHESLVVIIGCVLMLFGALVWKFGK